MAGCWTSPRAPGIAPCNSRSLINQLQLSILGWSLLLLIVWFAEGVMSEHDLDAMAPRERKLTGVPLGFRTGR
jgi:hypothetical protein